MSTKICIFGASVTWGEGDAIGGGWAGRLRNYFETNDYDILVYNLGVSGDTTSDLLKRFKHECEARKPNIIIIGLGLNDSQYIITNDNPRTTLEQFKNNFMELINQAKSFSEKVVLIGLSKVDETRTMPIPWDKKIFYDNDNIAKYNSVIEMTSNKFNLSFIDLLDLLRQNELKDGLHPNSIGHEKMFLRIKEFLSTNKIV